MRCLFSVAIACARDLRAMCSEVVEINRKRLFWVRVKRMLLVLHCSTQSIKGQADCKLYENQKKNICFRGTFHAAVENHAWGRWPVWFFFCSNVARARYKGVRIRRGTRLFSSTRPSFVWLSLLWCARDRRRRRRRRFHVKDAMYAA